MGGDGRVPGGRGGGSRPGGGRHRRAAAARPGAAGGHRDRPARGVLDGPWIVRGDRAGRGDALGWRAGHFAGREETMPFSPNARHVRGVAGERSFAGSVAWYRTTVIVPRAGVVRDPLRVGQPQGRRVGRRALRRPAHRDLPALRGPRAPDRRRAHARRARRLARPGGHEGRRLASHLVQLRRHQPPRLDPRARGQRARRRRRSSPIWTAPPRWSTSRSASPTAPARGPSPCAGRWPAPRCASVPSSSVAASAPPCARACASRARISGSPATRRSRGCASRSPARRSSPRASACARCAGPAGAWSSTARR